MRDITHQRCERTDPAIHRIIDRLDCASEPPFAQRPAQPLADTEETRRIMIAVRYDRIRLAQRPPE